MRSNNKRGRVAATVPRAYDEQGHLRSATLMDYELPSITDAPPKVETVILEVPTEHGPFGAKGVGEPPGVAAPAAIANAVADATAGRLTDLPITSEGARPRPRRHEVAALLHEPLMERLARSAEGRRSGMRAALISVVAPAG